MFWGSLSIAIDNQYKYHARILSPSPSNAFLCVAFTTSQTFLMQQQSGGWQL